MYDVCVVGSVNLDLVATVERLPGPGETVAGSAYHEYATRPSRWRGRAHRARWWVRSATMRRAPVCFA